MEQSKYTRTIWFPFLFLIVFLGLGIRLLQLQVKEKDKYLRLSKENSIKKVLVAAPRGLILARQGEILAESRPKFYVSFLPMKIKEQNKIIKTISALLNLPEELIIKRIEQVKKLGWGEPLKIARNLDFAAVSRIEERISDLPGVKVEVEPTRFYPKGIFAAHLLGYPGEITEAELVKQKSEGAASGGKEGYELGDYVGRDGIEKTYERLLRGEAGVEFIEVDAQGREVGSIEDLKTLSPLPGKIIYLTIEAKLQKVAEELLAPYPAGAIVVLNPQNGEILALVSKPGFDPNIFSEMKKEEWEELTKDKSFPLWDRAVKSGYPPGSTFKLLTAACALEENLIDEKIKLIPCTGKFKYGNRWFGCWKKEGHGSLDLNQAIVQSCDIYFYQLGAKLGLEKLSSFALKCGFGEASGIDLPQEGNGLVPTLDWYNKKFGEKKWSPGVVVNMAIGQGEILVTPLQLATFYGALGCQGIRHQPHLLLKVESLNESEVEIPELKIDSLPIRKENLEILKKALWGVVNDSKGTAWFSRSEIVQIAGKTGTAQNPHGKDHSWFVCFAPVDNPEIVVAVMVENIGHGSEFAAPMAKTIVETYFNKTVASREKALGLLGLPSLLSLSGY
ncbi:MAG: penicillin-binding protein 2 [Candidatus Edwardsbacteria bacterium]